LLLEFKPAAQPSGPQPPDDQNASEPNQNDSPSPVHANNLQGQQDHHNDEK
jgi:hypothetical protein